MTWVIGFWFGALRRVAATPILASLILTACAGAAPADVNACAKSETFVLVVHGGTIGIQVTDEIAAKPIQLLESVLEDGRARLISGGSALDAVEMAVRGLEDSGIVNAGKFAVANQGGFVETDASIMDGRTMEAGSVASMLGVKNPVSAARLVMEKSPHVLMVGDRGEAYVKELGAEIVPSDYFVNNGKKKQTSKLRLRDSNHGTVGAVALDRCGNLAAATSTGGFGAKIPGRVGDSPIIGASTYAENGVVAVSSTGHGEFFIRHAVAHDIRSRIAYLEEPAQEAADQVVVEKLGALDASGGIIAVTPAGDIVFSFNTPGLLRGSVSNTTPVFAAASKSR